MSSFPRSSALIDFQAATPAGWSPSGQAVERLAHSEGPQPMEGRWVGGWMDRWINLPSTSYQPQQSLVGEGECELSTHTHIRSQSLSFPALFLFCWGDNATQTCMSTCTQRESRAWGIPTMATPETRIIRHFSHTETIISSLKKDMICNWGPQQGGNF